MNPNADIGLLDGSLICEECDCPLLSEGDTYVHPWELSKKRLRELRKSKQVAEQLAKWVLYKVKRFCPEHGQAPPIAEEIPLTEDQLVAQLQTRRGIDDLYDFIQGLYAHSEDR